MCEDMSQGTFDILWDDLCEANDQNENSDNIITAVSELTSVDFLKEHGFDIELLFIEMNEDQNHENVLSFNSTTNTGHVTTELPSRVSSPITLSKSDELPSTSRTPVTPVEPNHANEFTSRANVILAGPNPVLPETNENSTSPLNNQERPSNSNLKKAEFMEISSTDVRILIENEENKNTLKKTLSDVAKFERFLESKQETKQCHQIEPDLLDEYLANFILSVRKPDGDEYEPSTIRNMVGSIDRKLRRQRYPHKIFSEQSNIFQLSRDALHAKQKSLKRLGKGNKPKKSCPISDQEIDMLYDKGILGNRTAKSLLNTIWINNCILFGLRGTKENYNLRWGDVCLKTSSDGVEYLELRERQTKTRTGSNINDVREVTPKIYATPDDLERCPVEMYKLYASKRPNDFCEQDNPFYISPRSSSQKVS
ncbi:zinc finger MYM-type protein 2-like [Ruditapes philippinarum]|uniref:zinc finger MYM-type protein 2-like n=1 Tax=Ruditapes philippinarum TaxID=129788 RepID=UPI00295A5860|nr:zinc finger MYM-type protein 2-like [Ruditapes philippinarum]